MEQGMQIHDRLGRAGVSFVPLLIMSVGLLGCSSSPVPAEVNPTATLLRVRILENQSQVQLTAAVAPRVFTTSDATPRGVRMSAGAPYALTLSAGGWVLGNVAMGTGQMTILPAVDGSVSINKARYHGTYRLVPVSATTFDVINDVEVEPYLKGVVTREMLHNWHPQALKAQAIVARTYARYEARHPPANQEWNLFADNRSQVYGGIDSETSAAIDAVQSTSGIVVAYGPAGSERIFKAYFSGCCGGATQSAALIQGIEIPPLMPRTTGGICSISPKYQWKTAAVSKEELTRRIRGWAAKINRSEQYMGPLDRIDIQAINSVGRPTYFSVTDTRGKRYVLACEDFRHAMNFEQKPTFLSSSYVTINNAATTIQFNGRGSGHGVGMCQWCCQAMALQGYSHESIILWQYPQAKLIRAY